MDSASSAEAINPTLCVPKHQVPPRYHILMAFRYDDTGETWPGGRMGIETVSTLLAPTLLCTPETQTRIWFPSSVSVIGSLPDFPLRLLKIDLGMSGIRLEASNAVSSRFRKWYVGTEISSSRPHRGEIVMKVESPCQAA